MNNCKQTRAPGLPYEALIIKILVVFGIDTMGEKLDSTNKIDHSLLRKIKTNLYHGELRNELMDKDKDMA